MACAVIAARQVPTLVLVDRKAGVMQLRRDGKLVTVPDTVRHGSRGGRGRSPTPRTL
jgi:hypothetical protein